VRILGPLLPESNVNRIAAPKPKPTTCGGTNAPYWSCTFVCPNHCSSRRYSTEEYSLNFPRRRVSQPRRADRPLAIGCGTSSSAASDNSPQILSGYEAYFGTYTVDETNHTVTHHLEGALTAADVGRNLVRQFQISGDQLTIVVRTNLPKEKQIRTLTWGRKR